MLWTSIATASLVFGILYLIIFASLTALFATGRIKFKSRYSLLYLHVLIRLASQACGLTFGIIGYEGFTVLIAYFILGAEGYFTLVLCTARFLVSWHNHHFGDSWLEARGSLDGLTFLQRLGAIFTIKNLRKNPLAIVHWLLIAASALVIAGGSISTASYASSYGRTSAQTQSRRQTAKALRATGLVIFLLINVALYLCIARTVQQAKKKLAQGRNGSSTNSVHPTLLLLLCTFPFLCARGTFGVCQALLPDLNYFYAGYYGQVGVETRIVVVETVLATMTEWISCVLLLATYCTSRNDPAEPVMKYGREERLRISTSRGVEEASNED